MANIVTHGTHFHSYYPAQVSCKECAAVFVPHWGQVLDGYVAYADQAYLFTKCPDCDCRIDIGTVARPDAGKTDFKLPHHKIIHRGTPKHSREQTCQNCTCVFRLPVADEPSHCNTAPVIACPECNMSVKFAA